MEKRGMPTPERAPSHIPPPIPQQPEPMPGQTVGDPPLPPVVLKLHKHDD